MFHIRMNRNRRRSQSRWQGSKSTGFAGLEPLEPRILLSGLNPNETIDNSLTATQLAQALVGGGVTVSNATFTGGVTASGSFNFVDPTVIGFGQGILLSSGNVADVVGPNLTDYTSTDYTLPGDADLDALSGFTTYDAAVLEFDFTPTANQVVFEYTFASDEYPEWVNTPYNDVFAFFVNGTNYAVVRQTAGDPNSPFVPVAVNNINNSNPVQDPLPTPMRPDLFRPNYVTLNGTPSVIDLEQDGLTTVLTFQAPVVPGVVNQMKLAIADASDGIYDSAVFIKAGSLVSNENPVADLSVAPDFGVAPLQVTAFIEGEDPNNLPISYVINWGDGTSTDSGPLNLPANESQKTAAVNHTYANGGDYIVTLTVSNGQLSGTSIEDVHVTGGQQGGIVITTHPTNQSVLDGQMFTFTAAATGDPTPTVQWQVSSDSGNTFIDILGATGVTYSGFAMLSDNGNLYQAVFTNANASETTNPALLSVSPVTTTPPDAPVVALANDTGFSPSDLVTKDGTLNITGLVDGALVEYSTDGGVMWTTSFSAVEGFNDVLVRQTDADGNISDPTPFSFELDTFIPAMPGVALASDSGKLSTDDVTNDATLMLANVENLAVVEYSADGGGAWSDSFTPMEGANSVQVRQTDPAGNVSDSGTLDFVLDTASPVVPGVALQQDTGSSSVDKLSNVGTLALTAVETDADVEYSTDAGGSWDTLFSAVEGGNSVTVRQTDLAGNVSDTALFSFTLDTTPPALNPSFSSPSPFLVGATGITVSPNASDVNGIASQSAGAVVTDTPGSKSVTVTATDNAGNTAATSVPYLVGYGARNVLPAVNSAYKRKASIPVSFQLVDINGLISDQTATSLRPSITVAFDNLTPVGVSYKKKANTFSVSVKTGNPPVGDHTITINLTIGGVVVTQVIIPVRIV